MTEANPSLVPRREPVTEANPSLVPRREPMTEANPSLVPRLLPLRVPTKIFLPSVHRGEPGNEARLIHLGYMSAQIVYVSVIFDPIIMYVQLAY